MVFIDVVSLLGMGVSLIFTIITMIMARDGTGRTDDARYEVYHAIESADIRAFLPHKQNANNESTYEVIQSRLSTFPCRLRCIV